MISPLSVEGLQLPSLFQGQPKHAEPQSKSRTALEGSEALRDGFKNDDDYDDDGDDGDDG